MASSAPESSESRERRQDTWPPAHRGFRVRHPQARRRAILWRRRETSAARQLRARCECVARNIQLHPMALAQVRANDVTFGRSVFQQHQNFDRIAKVIMI